MIKICDKLLANKIIFWPLMFKEVKMEKWLPTLEDIELQPVAHKAEELKTLM